jgi:hypothetical protein
VISVGVLAVGTVDGSSDRQVKTVWLVLLWLVGAAVVGWYCCGW